MHRNLPNSVATTNHFTYICYIVVYSSLVLGFGWFGYFIWLQDWDLAISLMVLGVLVIPCWILALRGLFSHSLVLAQIICLIYVIFFCYHYDISTVEFQRTTHLYIPIIALVGYINYKQTKSRLQILIILLSLVFFVLLSSNAGFLTTDKGSARYFQNLSMWLNPLMATVLLAGGIVAMHSDFSAKAKLVKGIQNAVYNDQFILLYQPIVNEHGKVIGAEALLRWHHPSAGLIPPSGFIPDAQEAGLMPMVGEWVISEAFKALLNWQNNADTRHLTVSINITADHFMQPDFARKLLTKAYAKNIPCNKVHLELTESAFVSEPEAVAARMDELSEAGFRFSLDDFGTGFSSLSTLRRLPLNQIKIDRSFVASAKASIKDAVIAKNIARMGTELGLEVVAEGIETEQQWSAMRGYGCRIFQGFFFSKPVSHAEFIKYTLANQHP